MQTVSNASGMFNLLVNPMNAYHRCYDCHFIIYLENHPDIEALEAMVLQEDTKNPMIRAIITNHDKTQADCINYESLQNDSKGQIYRNIHQTHIEYAKTQDGKRIRIHMKFKTDKGTEVVLELHTASPVTGRHCRLVDPQGHSADSSMPVMYPVRNAIAAPDSFVSIDGVKYLSPVKISIPLFFKAVQGYYSELFQMGVIRAGIENVTLIKAPDKLEIGQSWVYEAMGRELRYPITETGNGLIRVERDSERITMQQKYGILIWKEIEYRHKTGTGQSPGMSIRFTSGLPVSGSINHFSNCSSEFSISMNNHISLIKGSVRAYQNNGTTMLRLEPERPSWAHERPVIIKIAEDGSRYRIETSIGRSI